MCPGCDEKEEPYDYTPMFSPTEDVAELHYKQARVQLNPYRKTASFHSDIGLPHLDTHTYENYSDLDDVFQPAVPEPDILRDARGEYFPTSNTSRSRAYPIGVQDGSAYNSVSEDRGSPNTFSTRTKVILWILVGILIAISVGLAAIAGLSLYRQMKRHNHNEKLMSEIPCQYPMVYNVPNFRGMILDKQTHNLVIVTRDIHGPLKVYNCHGNLQLSLGGGLWEVATGRKLDIAVDTKRGQYLVPCQNKLMSIHRHGQGTVIIPVLGDLRGVTYLEKEDLYIVGEADSCTIHIINPNNSTVIGTISNTSLCKPRFISSYLDKATGQSIIVLSKEKEMVVFNIVGSNIRKLSGMDARFGSLMGVSSDTSGLVFGCDQCKRPGCHGAVVRHMGLSYGSGWKTIVNQTKMDNGIPCSIDHDPEISILAVGTNKGKIYVFNYVHTLN